MNNVIVTGGSGYIGSHVVMAIRAAGFQPIIIDKNYDVVEAFRSSKGLPSLGAGINADCGFDFSKEVLECTNGITPIAVIHLAGSIEVSESVSNPLKYLDNNTANTIHLLRTAEKMGINNIIFSSTAAVYGTKSFLIDEDDSLNPINPYGVSKLLAEQAIRTSRLNHVIFRFFNAAGADHECRTGENHDPETHLIPRVLGSLANKDLITVYGTDYLTNDGTCVRDYVHVSDIADAHVLALSGLLNNMESTTLNLGSGRHSSVKDVIKIAQEVTGITGQIQYLNRRAGDPATLLADHKKAYEQLAWQPTRSDLKTIISDAWNWYIRIN